MDKKKNHFIKRVEKLKDPLDKLNNIIEEKCVNSSVLIVCDFLTLKHYEVKLKEIETSSVNNIVIKVLNFNEFNEYGVNKIKEILNETFDLIVGIGDFSLLKFVESFAIKTNISYAFVNMFELKSELFCKNLSFFYQKEQYFPPYFILIKELEYTKSEIFRAKLNLFKYYYLFLEYYINVVKQQNLKEFLKEYKNLLFNINDENIISSIISLGLILNKFDIQYFIKFNLKINDFEYFLCSTLLIMVYESIFLKITINNLTFSRTYKNSVKKILDFQRFDFDFYKFYLLSVKNNIKKITLSLKKCFYNFCESLKNTCIKSFYEYSKIIDEVSILDKVKNNKSELFLSFLDKFEIFNF